MTGRKADVIQAAYTAAEVALRMVVPGGDVSAVHVLVSMVTLKGTCDLCRTCW